MKRAIVVGSGIAGLIAALELSATYAVTLVTKSRLAESNTRWAQGGIAAAMSSDDSVAEHVADTLGAGAGLCNREAVEVLCAEGPERIRDLIRLGVRFDRDGGAFCMGLEAAHSRARVLHAGGDATGLSIETALVRAVRHAGITILEHTFAVDLLLEGDAVVGLNILGEDQTLSELYADAVVLASGGAGQLYVHTTNPSVATGDGVAMALRAGAEVADTEFYQFHPTALAVSQLPGENSFLISEAVRGEGALLLDQNGRRFMQAIHPAAELAPRDVVARGIARQMAVQHGAPVLLDATHLSAGFLASRFPTIDAAVRSRGLDWSATYVPVTPAAHYWMGGVRTDIFGRTSIPGLYAVGEVACTGVHGANRLASNSLLESLVFAWRCAHLLLDGDKGSRSWTALNQDVAGSAPEAHALDTSRDALALHRPALQKLMWSHAGIERCGEGLRAAAAQLSHWRVEGTTVHDLETANLLTLARALVSAALAREESRGAHFRSDYPEVSDRFQHSMGYGKETSVVCS